MRRNISPRDTYKIALVSAPWPLFNRPSIQIGTLKAYLKNEIPDLAVAAYHFYLSVADTLGRSVYQNLAQKSWRAEAIYSAMLYPERFDPIRRLYRRKAVQNSVLKDIQFESIVEKVERTTQRFLKQIAWDAFGLVGFSICLCQLTATLYLIRQIKTHHPELFVVVGGSMFTGLATRSLMAAFPQIDAVVSGEGERPLSALVRHLRSGAAQSGQPEIPGLTWRTEQNTHRTVETDQLPDLHRLPIPDYEDYFAMLASYPPSRRFFPILPVEASRGCRWQTTNSPKQRSGCAFCTLNRQWHGYRCKSPERIVKEVEALVDKHKVLSIAFTDNLLPVEAQAKAFRDLADIGRDLRLFGEVRATTPWRHLKAMQQAGMAELQVGIEALSNRLLKKMNKGTQVIQNLEIMKHCEELGIACISNLIVEFPGSDAEDVSETLQNLAFALPFRPLKCVAFWLGVGSLVYRHPQDYGIKATFNHQAYRILFPENVYRTVRFMTQGYRGGIVHQRKLWRPVRQSVRQWAVAYDNLMGKPFAEPVLSYRDGCEFLIIKHRRYGRDAMTHRLEGTSREIYLYCRRRRSLDQILARFPGFGELEILPFLRMMVAKHLMFGQDQVYLSLAVRVDQAATRRCL